MRTRLPPLLAGFLLLTLSALVPGPGLERQASTPMGGDLFATAAADGGQHKGASREKAVLADSSEKWARTASPVRVSHFAQSTEYIGTLPIACDSSRILLRKERRVFSPPVVSGSGPRSPPFLDLPVRFHA